MLQRNLEDLLGEKRRSTKLKILSPSRQEQLIDSSAYRCNGSSLVTYLPKSVAAGSGGEGYILAEGLSPAAVAGRVLPFHEVVMLQRSSSRCLAMRVQFSRNGNSRKRLSAFTDTGHETPEPIG